MSGTVADLLLDDRAERVAVVRVVEEVEVVRERIDEHVDQRAVLAGRLDRSVQRRVDPPADRLDLDPGLRICSDLPTSAHPGGRSRSARTVCSLLTTSSNACTRPSGPRSMRKLWPWRIVLKSNTPDSERIDLVGLARRQPALLEARGPACRTCRPCHRSCRAVRSAPGPRSRQRPRRGADPAGTPGLGQGARRHHRRGGGRGSASRLIAPTEVFLSHTNTYRFTTTSAPSTSTTHPPVLRAGGPPNRRSDRPRGRLTFSCELSCAS